MVSSTSPPPGFSQRRWQRAVSPASVSSAPRNDHVSGLGISSSSGDASVGGVAPDLAAAGARGATTAVRGRAQADPGGWQNAPQSNRTRWLEWKERQRAAAPYQP